MLFTDQLNNTIELLNIPKRIISLVPSQSELLWDLGLRTELVGVTKFCIHPQTMFNTIERVGGTKQLNLDKIRALKPDLIIGNKEENEQTQINELQKEFKVWMSDIYNLEDSLDMINKLGIVLDRIELSQQISQQIHSSFSNLKQYNGTALYLIWNNPFMAAGKSTFIGDMMNRIGLLNCLDINITILSNIINKHRYPELSIETIKALNPSFIFLSSEPYPFKDIHVKELQNHFPKSKVILVDGEMFSWYGSRLLKSVDYFNSLLI